MGSAETLLDDTGLFGEQAVNKNQYLTFILAGEEYGVDILRVQEIKGWDSVTPIPNAPAYIKGVINIRGTIVPVIDLRLRFNIEALEYGLMTVMIVLKVFNGDKHRIMGVVVDAVSDVYDITSDQIRPTPDFGAGVNVEYLKGLATVNDKMVILLDIDNLMNTEDMHLMSLNQSQTTNNKGLDIDLLEQSFNEMAPNAETLVSRFYEELFKRFPAVQDLFKNTSMDEQRKKLLSAIKLVVSNIRNPQALKESLTNLGKRHNEYGAKPEHFQAVKSTLLDVMQEISGATWTMARKQTWDNALQYVASTMLSGYKA